MLLIRKEQIEIFKQVSLKRFEDEMVAYSQDFSPKLSRVLGEEGLRLAVNSAMMRADSYGFTNRGPIRLFIELMFLFGSSFDTDPQYPWAKNILRNTADQMQRAQLLYEKTLDYQKKVSGPDATNTLEALRKLSQLPNRSLTFGANDFVPGMLREMAHIFPEKAAYLGKQSLQALIAESFDVAQRAHFPTTRGHTLILSLMFAFGHGCVNDPLYPWIANTLTDDKIVDSGARAVRLERKSLTWLDHVIANTHGDSKK